MARKFTESGMEIEFPEDWEVLNYEATGERWRAAPQRVIPMAVDFVLLKPGRKICFLELKGFQGTGPGNTHKLLDESLETVVAGKVRDSIAGVIGFARTGDTAADFTPFAKAVGNPAVKFEITLWVEADHTLLHNRTKKLLNWSVGNQGAIWKNIEMAKGQRGSTFYNRMKTVLSWASAEVQLCNRGNIGVLVPGTVVRNAPAKPSVASGTATS